MPIMAPSWCGTNAAWFSQLRSGAIHTVEYDPVINFFFFITLKPRVE